VGLLSHLENMIVGVHQNVHVREDKLLVDQRSYFFSCFLRHFAAVNFF
jgi:hypothetical protein